MRATALAPTAAPPPAPPTPPATGGGIENSGELIAQRCLFAYNVVQGGDANGGAIRNGFSGRMVLTNCTITRNVAAPLANEAGHGAGILNQGLFSGNSRIVNCTIVSNEVNDLATGSSGAGVGVYTQQNTLEIQNTIISGNTNGGYQEVFGQFMSQGYNTISDTTGSSGWVISDGTNISVPLGILLDNGGPTDTCAVPAGSVVINAGNNANAPLSDQRGYARTGTVDIGAFEFSGVELRITNVARSGSDLLLTFQGAANRTYHLEQKTALSGAWTPAGVSDLTPGANGAAQFTHPNALTSAEAFYRIQLLNP